MSKTSNIPIPRYPNNTHVPHVTTSHTVNDDRAPTQTSPNPSDNDRTTPILGAILLSTQYCPACPVHNNDQYTPTIPGDPTYSYYQTRNTSMNNSECQILNPTDKPDPS